jgi:hypothetical protein
MNKVLIVGGAVVAALGLSALIVGGRDITGHGDQASQSTAQNTGLPWQVEALPEGASKVMSLVLAGAPEQASTLRDAKQRWGEAMQVAIIAAPGEDGTLEAFVDPAQAGFITGKVVLTAQLPTDQLRAMRERALKAEFMESTTRKYVLAPSDLAEALKAPITALSFIPQANLDEAMIVARFGQPAQRVRSNGHVEHFLYPAKGLDLALDSEGKELLQYVAPSAFHKLAQPLAKAGAPASAAASTP